MTKEQIVADLARSRAAISRDHAGLRRELDFRSKFDRVVRRNPLAWFGGAAALGWILSGPKTRTRTRTVVRPAREGERPRAEEKIAARTGFVALLLGVFRFLLPIIRPALMTYASKWIVDAAGRFGR